MKKIIVSTILLAPLLFADVTATGIGETSSKAKKEALSALSQVIKSDVRTHIEMIDKEIDSKYKTDTLSNITVSSNLPILGTKFITLESATNYKVEAKLISKNVNKLYTKELQRLKNEIRSNIQEIRASKHSDSDKIILYQKIDSLLKEYNRYESVATILGIKGLKRPLITLAKVESKILTLRSNINSLEMATTILAESFQNRAIFVAPPTLDHNSNVAQFGSVFQKMLRSKIKYSSRYKKAKYILEGVYSLSKKAMILNYQLVDATTKDIISSKTIKINKKAYSHLITKSKSVDFNTLLKSGIAQSSDLKVSLSSNRGTQQLLFSDGEDVELFVKLNKKGYLYIVGYTQTKNGKFSYLLELSEGHNDSRFLKFINADDASRWISLGVFEVAKPFGIESLQVIASNKKIKKLPKTHYDEDLEYYVISTNIKKALATARGLRPKRGKKVETSEDVLSFRTIK